MKTSDGELSDQEAISFYNTLMKTYGELLPNFHHSPLEFEHFVRLYRFKAFAEKHGLENPEKVARDFLGYV